MIFAVDDEEAYLEVVKDALEQDGLSVVAFTDPEEALDRALDDEPELIISDVRMPRLDGFGLRAALAERFPERDTPFVFLSSMADPEDVLRGLEAEVDDYLTKPIDPRILRAKVRLLLGTRKKHRVPVFHGDLQRYPFIKVVQWCELQGLTGEVEFRNQDHVATVPFRAGNIISDDLENSNIVLADLYDLEEGTFTIRTGVVDFGELSDAGVEVRSRSALPEADRVNPMGRLSGVEVNDRLFQIQTEMVNHPEPSILTVVVLDGNTVFKRHSTPLPGADRAELEHTICQQHTAVEEEVNHRVEDLAKRKIEGPSSAKERYYQLFEAGLENYRRGELAEALEQWQEAKKLNPEDTVLDINLKVVLAKLNGER